MNSLDLSIKGTQCFCELGPPAYQACMMDLGRPCMICSNAVVALVPQRLNPRPPPTFKRFLVTYQQEKMKNTMNIPVKHSRPLRSSTIYLQFSVRSSKTFPRGTKWWKFKRSKGFWKVLGFCKSPQSSIGSWVIEMPSETHQPLLYPPWKPSSSVNEPGSWCFAQILVSNTFDSNENPGPHRASHRRGKHNKCQEYDRFYGGSSETV